MIHSWGNHFGKRTEWSLIYFLIYAYLFYINGFNLSATAVSFIQELIRHYAYLNILAQSQILVISLYIAQYQFLFLNIMESRACFQNCQNDLRYIILNTLIFDNLIVQSF